MAAAKFVAALLIYLLIVTYLSIKLQTLNSKL